MVDPRTPERDQNLGGNTSAKASVGSSLTVVSSTMLTIVTTTRSITARPTMVTTIGHYAPSLTRETHEGVVPTSG